MATDKDFRVKNGIKANGDITTSGSGDLRANERDVIANEIIAGYGTGDALFRTYNTGDHLKLQTYDSGTSAFTTSLEVMDNKEGIKTYNMFRSGHDNVLFGTNMYPLGNTGSTQANDWNEVFKWEFNQTMSSTTSAQYQNFSFSAEVVGRGIQTIRYQLYGRGEYGVQDSNGWWATTFTVEGLNDVSSEDVFLMVYNAGTSLSKPNAKLYYKRTENWELRGIKINSMFKTNNLTFTFEDTNVGETTPTNDGNTGSSDKSPNEFFEARFGNGDNTNNKELYRGLATTNVFFDTSTERMGIGEETPSTPLHIKSTTTTLDNLLTLENNGASGTPGVGIKMFSNVGTTNYLEILHDAFGATNFKTVNGASTYSNQLKLESDGNVSISNDLTVSGNLTVSGTTTTVDTTNLNITDNTITLNDGETGAGVTLGTSGIDIDRGTATNATFLYDDSIDGWVADSQGTQTTLKLQNTHGYIEFGPQNTSYAHITTDRTRFYFNRDLVIGENAISSYNGDFSVRRSQSTDEQIVIGDDSMTFTSAGNDVLLIDGTNSRLAIGTSTHSGGKLTIDHNVTNPETDAPGSFAIHIDADLSGSTTATADREQGGIFVDLDTSATGGDASDEHRPYGVWADVRVNSESDADTVYGIYGYTEAQRSGATGATTSVLRGGYFFAATDETSDHTVSELTGSLGYASIQDAGTVTTSQGLRGFTNVNSSRTTNVGSLRGVSAEVDISGGRTDGSDITTGDSAVFRATLDHNPAASGEGTVTIANSYLYYGVSSITDSSQVTNNFGLYLTGEDKNYFSGSVGIGVSAPTDTLAVSGGIKIGEFNSTDGTGYSGTSPPSDHNNGTGASDPQIRVSGRTSDAPGIIQMAFFDANNFFGGTGEFTLGRLQYAMNENSNTVTTVAELRGVTSDPNTAGDFDGALTFLTSQGDGSGANLTEKMRLTSDGDLGIGTSSPDATLDIKTGGSGSRTAFNAVADDLVVDSTGDTGITISSSNTATGNVFFADSDNDSRGQIRYDHSGNTMRFATSGTERFRIGSSGELGIGGATYGTSGQVLTSGGSGAAPSWTTISGSGSPAGSDSQIQYNNGGSFGGDADFTWDDTNNRLVIGSVTSQHDGLSKLTVKGTDAGFLLEKHDDSASGGPTIQLYRYSASEADGDLIGQINFRGEGSTGNPSTYMAIRTEIVDTTEGSKDGNLIIRGLQGNTQTDFMQVGQKVQIGPESINPSGVTAGKLTVSRNDTDDLFAPTLLLVDGDADANNGPMVKMYRNTSSPADNDELGSIFFAGEDSAGNERTYASIRAISTDVTSGTNDGELKFQIMSGGLQTTSVELSGTGLTLSKGTFNGNVGTTTYKPVVYMDTGTQNVNQTEATIGFNSEVLDPAGNASSTTDGHIRLAAGGYYRVSYSIPINDDGSTLADRTRVFCFAQVDDNDSFTSPTTVAQSRCQVYTRESSGGSGLSTSFIYEHTANDYIRLRIDAQNNTDISTESNQSQISIEYLGPA